MPWYLRVGPIKENVSGRGARGYGIFQKGKTVQRIWGGIAFKGGEVVWRKGWPRSKKDKFPSNQQAQRYIDLITRRKLRYKDTPYRDTSKWPK